jgi:hypothetical protein
VSYDALRRGPLTHEYCRNAEDIIIKPAANSDEVPSKCLVRIKCKRTGRMYNYFESACKYYKEAK